MLNIRYTLTIISNPVFSFKVMHFLNKLLFPRALEQMLHIQFLKIKTNLHIQIPSCILQKRVLFNQHPGQFSAELLCRLGIIAKCTGSMHTFVNPGRACSSCPVCQSVCVSVTSYLTSEAFVRHENTATYSAHYKGQKVCGVFSETAPLQRSSTPSLQWLYMPSATFPADNMHAHCAYAHSPRLVM